MRTAKVCAIGVVLALLVASFPTWGYAQSCCPLQKAAVQSSNEGGEKSPAPQAAEPAPAERETLEAMVAWYNLMMRRCAYAMGIETSAPQSPSRGELH